jgi:16S rRNA (adenine1518-N6/adenine1519-N6)-dimethyltransferase
LKSNQNNYNEEISTEEFSLAKETKNILKKHGIRLNKNLGQNYLIDEAKRDKIIDFGKISQEDIVLEIGPGIGTLTLELSKKAKKIIAIEQDKRIYNILKQRLEDESIDNVELINADGVKTDFSSFNFNKIVSNLPYQISSPITFKFLESNFDLAILMYQKEFAERMIVKTGEKNYSRLKAMLHFKADIEFLSSVSPESFIPKPKVYSSVVKLIPYNYENVFNNENPSFEENFHLYKNNADLYSKLCKAIFPHKNKKLRNALIDSRHILGYTDKKELRELIDSNSSLNPFLAKRVINTSPEEILKLVVLLKSIIK